MKFGVTVALFLALLAIVSAFRTENKMQLRQEDDDSEELSCDNCSAEYCQENFVNWASCCLGRDACADDSDEMSRDCCGFPEED